MIDLLKINYIPVLFALICTVSQPCYCQQINIHSIHTLRQTGSDCGYTLNGGHMRGSRAKLLSTDNFGPEGIYPKTVHITDAYLETESLCQINSDPDIDIFFFGTFNKQDAIPFSSSEIDSLY